MDFVNKLAGGNSQNQQSQPTSSTDQQQSSGGFLSGIGDKINSAAGGGRESEKNEDYLDKGKPLPCLLPFHHANVSVSQASTMSRRSSWARVLRTTRHVIIVLSWLCRH